MSSSGPTGAARRRCWMSSRCWRHLRLATSAVGSSSLGGMTSLLSLGRAQQMSFHLSMAIPERNPIEYYLTMAPTAIAYEIKDEALTQQQTPTPSPFKYIQSQNRNIKYRNTGSKSSRVRHGSITRSRPPCPRSRRCISSRRSFAVAWRLRPTIMRSTLPLMLRCACRNIASSTAARGGWRRPRLKSVLPSRNGPRAIRSNRGCLENGVPGLRSVGLPTCRRGHAGDDLER